MYPPKKASVDKQKVSEARRQRLLELAKKADEKMAEKLSSTKSKSSTTNNTTSAPVSANTNEKSAPDVANTSNPVPAVQTSPTSTAAMPGKYDWSRLDMYAQIVAAQDELGQKQEKHRVQEHLKVDLDRQVTAVRQRKQKEKEDDLKYFRNQAVELDQWKTYEQKVTEERRRKAEQEKRDRDEQLQFEALRKKEAVERKRREEEALVERINKEIVDEKRRIQERKLAEKRASEAVRIENEEEKKIKDEIKRRQIQLDFQSMEEYNRLLDQQDLNREGEMRARVEKQKELVKRMEERVLKQQTQKANDDLHRALKQQAEADQRADEVDKYKQGRLRELRDEMRHTLDNQIMEREHRKAQENAIKAIEAQILQADTEEFQKGEKVRVEMRKKTNQAYKEQLERQIEEIRGAKGKVRKYEMSDEEKKLNKQLIELVDKTLIEGPSGLSSPVISQSM